MRSKDSSDVISLEASFSIQKVCLSTKFSHQEIRWNYGIFYSGSYFETFSNMEKICISYIDISIVTECEAEI